MELDVRKLAEQVLDEGFVMDLATIDEIGPWSAPITFVREGFNLWWVSEPSARHSKALEKDSRAAGAVVASHAVDDERALQMEGTVEIHAEHMPHLEELLAHKRGMPTEKESSEIRNGKYFWYCFKPKRIGLIFGKHFGYEVKNVPL